MQDVLQAAGGPAGVVLVVIGLASLLQTFVVPRGRERGPVRWASVAVSHLLRPLAALARSFAGKDRVLAWWGPLILMLLLAMYLALFHLGWALVLWSVLDEPSFPQALREAGSSLYTLGFASTPAGGATAIDFMAAATGLLTVALLIAYLPVLYAAFSRRETLVTMLQSRAGTPAWGPEILARHQAVGIVANLPHLYGDWEMWAADVAESHTNYPMLVGFRSPHPLRSWVLGLLAVLDAAALHLAFLDDEAPSEARLCLRMGFTCLRDVADVLGLPYDPDPDPDGPLVLTRDAYDQGVARLEDVGFPMHRTPEEAWAHFRGWRVNYEELAYAIADLVVAPPAPWSGVRSRLRGVEIEPISPIDRRPGGEVRHIDVPTIDG